MAFYQQGHLMPKMAASAVAAVWFSVCGDIRSSLTEINKAWTSVIPSGGQILTDFANVRSPLIKTPVLNPSSIPDTNPAHHAVSLRSLSIMLAGFSRMNSVLSQRMRKSDTFTCALTEWGLKAINTVSRIKALFTVGLSFSFAYFLKPFTPSCWAIKERTSAMNMFGPFSVRASPTKLAMQRVAFGLTMYYI